MGALYWGRRGATAVSDGDWPHAIGSIADFCGGPFETLEPLPAATSCGESLSHSRYPVV